MFLVTALGGFFLIAQHLQKRALPIPVMLAHGPAAVAGFILLFVAMAGFHEAWAPDREDPLHAALSDFHVVLLRLWVEGLVAVFRFP